MLAAPVALTESQRAPVLDFQVAQEVASNPCFDCLGYSATACDHESWWDNLYFFGFMEGFGLNAQHRVEDRAAGRLGANLGLPLGHDLGFQIGGSGSWAGGGEQFFITTGLFARGGVYLGDAWNVGGVIDWIDEKNDEIDLFQIRLKTSVTLDPSQEIGLWGAIGLTDDETDDFTTARPVDQVNLFYRYLCAGCWDVTGWVGWRERPDSVALGGELVVPLDNFWSLAIGGHYAPGADTWNAYVGVLLYPGGGAMPRTLEQYRYRPYLPVADNSTMTVTIGK
jgi:hypothetical protein